MIRIIFPLLLILVYSTHVNALEHKSDALNDTGTPVNLVLNNDDLATILQELSKQYQFELDVVAAAKISKKVSGQFKGELLTVIRQLTQDENTILEFNNAGRLAKLMLLPVGSESDINANINHVSSDRPGALSRGSKLRKRANKGARHSEKKRAMSKAEREIYNKRLRSNDPEVIEFRHAN